MNPREPAFSEKTGCLYKLSSGFFHFRTQALLFTTALGSAPAQIVPPHSKQTVLTGTPDIIWQVSQIVKCWFCYSVDKGRHSGPAKNLGINKTISPSTSKVKYIPADVS